MVSSFWCAVDYGHLVLPPSGQLSQPVSHVSPDSLLAQAAASSVWHWMPRPVVPMELSDVPENLAMLVLTRFISRRASIRRTTIVMTILRDIVIAFLFMWFYWWC